MKEYTYDFTIKAGTEAEADTKMKALQVLAGKLKANELAKLASVLQNDPLKVRIAKTALGL